jgi:hypothetical protein
MKKLHTILFVLLSFVTYAQSDKNNSDLTTIKHSIDFEPFSITYSINQTYSKKANFGFGVQLGAAYRYFLNNPTFKKRVYNTDSANYTLYLDSKLKPAINSLFEIFQVKVFYRYFITQSTYLNAGGFFGLGFLYGIESSKLHNSVGFQSDFFTGFKHIKFGSRVQLCNVHISYNSEQKTNMFAFLITPIVFQILL